MSNRRDRKSQPSPGPERPWRVRVEASRRLDPLASVLSFRAVDHAVSTARDLGADLLVEADGYVARFLVTSDCLEEATRSALTRWIDMVQRCDLPTAASVSLSVERRAPATAPRIPGAHPSDGSQPPSVPPVTDMRTRLPIVAQ